MSASLSVYPADRAPNSERGTLSDAPSETRIRAARAAIETCSVHALPLRMPGEVGVAEGVDLEALFATQTADAFLTGTRPANVTTADREPTLQGWTNEEASAALARYEGLVRVEVRRLRGLALRTNVLDEDDLRAEGRIAVLEALRRFQGWGVQESTWVRMRVRQRMVDAVRRTSLWSRLDSRVVGAESRGEDLSARDHERARAAQHRRMVSFDADTGDHSSLAETLSDPRALAVDELVDLVRREDRLQDALADLPVRSRRVVEAIVTEGRAGREVAAELGVTESRISQLLHGAIAQLRGHLTGEASATDAAPAATPARRGRKTPAPASSTP